MLETKNKPFSWGFEAGFLRSPVNPRMLLLNRTPEIDCSGDENESSNARAWGLVSIANDLLRVDLSSFFNEIGARFNKHTSQRSYIELQNAIHRPPASPSHEPNDSTDQAAESNHNDQPGPDDPDWEPEQAELSEAEIELLLQKQKELDLDFFDPIFDETITRHAHGEISSEARYLLKNVCRQCIMSIAAIPDYRYFACWMENNAIECDEINHLYRAVITTSGRLNSQEMAALFSSYLRLKSNNMKINTAYGSIDLTEPVPYNHDNPKDSYPKVKSQIETACVCTNLELFRALLIVFYQGCLELVPSLKNTRAPELLSQKEELFPIAIWASDPRRFQVFDKQLPGIIDFGDSFLRIAKKRLPGNETVQRLEKHLDDIKRMSDAPFMQLFRTNYVKAMRDNDIYAREDFHKHAELNNQEELNELVNRQAIIAKAGELYFTEEEWSFASLYARILHELLLCDIMPITCQTCGSLFFPTGPNSKYCDRYNDKTKLYCNPRFNAEKHLGRKSPRDVALNIQRKTETAYEKGLTDCAHYFERLGSFVLDGLGPAYQANDLISDELYRTWLSIVNQPNCKAKDKRPDRIDYPYSVLWYGVVLNGNRYTRVEFPGTKYPALFERLQKLAEHPRSKCTLDYKGPGEHPYSSWHVKLYELLEAIAQINNADRMAKHIPLLGIDGSECVSIDWTVQDTWNTPDACIYSTGTIDDLSFTVYTKGYDPEKQG